MKTDFILLALDFLTLAQRTEQSSCHTDRAFLYVYGAHMEEKNHCDARA